MTDKSKDLEKRIRSAVDADLGKIKEESPDKVLEGLKKRLEILEYSNASVVEVGELTKSVRDHFDRRNNALKTMRIILCVTLTIALIAGLVVGWALHCEIQNNFSGWEILGENKGIAVSAFIASSFGFILALIIVTIRGVFGGIQKAEEDIHLPPQLAEITKVISDTNKQ